MASVEPEAQPPPYSIDMSPTLLNGIPGINGPATLSDVIDDLKDSELSPVLSPARYIGLLDIDVHTLARNAHVSVDAITETPGATKIQAHLRDNLRVIQAAYEASDGNLAKSLHWFRFEPLPAFGLVTAEQVVAAGHANDVFRLVDSLYGGAAG